MAKRSPTTKDIALLHQLFKEGQLNLAPEFQRNSVWPAPAKAYLIDTVLNDRPIPIFFMQKTTSTQTGRPGYSVIDGQQRLRAIFDFLDDRFRLSQSKGKPFSNKTFSALTEQQKNQIYNYDLVVEELSGYSEADIKDMFVRMNKYVVKLAPQELRHAVTEGKFRDFVEKLGKLDFWRTHKVFSPKQLKRMRAVEFSAELTVLLIEGPQDKKKVLNLYYDHYIDKFPYASSVETRLKDYLAWITSVLPDLSKHRYRSPVDLYSLIGALDMVSEEGKRLSKLKRNAASAALLAFEEETRAPAPTGNAAKYVAAASRQTDNVIPRKTRIEVLAEILRTS